MAEKLDTEFLLAKHGELLVLYQDLEGIVQIPLDLDSVEGQSWIRAISYRIIQELTEADMACWEAAGENKTMVEFWPPKDELIDSLFYYLELVILTNLQSDLSKWNFLGEMREKRVIGEPYSLPLEFLQGFPSLFWRTTVEIGKLNQLLRKRPWREEGAEIDIDSFTNIMKEIWFLINCIFFKRELSPEEIKIAYMDKWRKNYKRAQIAKIERELLIKQTLLNPPKIVVDKTFGIRPIEEEEK